MNIVNILWNLFTVPVRQILWHLWWVRRRLFAVGNQGSYFNTNAIDAFMSSPDFFMRFTVCIRSISIDAGLMSSWTSWLTLHRLSWRPLRILSSNCLWTSLNLLRFHVSMAASTGRLRIAFHGCGGWYLGRYDAGGWKSTRPKKKSQEWSVSNQCKDCLDGCAWILFILFILFIWLLSKHTVCVGVPEFGPACGCFIWPGPCLWPRKLSGCIKLRMMFFPRIHWRAWWKLMRDRHFLSHTWHFCISWIDNFSIFAFVQAQGWKTSVRCGSLINIQGWSWVTIFDGIQVLRKKQWSITHLNDWRYTRHKMVSLGFSEKTSDNPFVFRHTRGVIPVHNMCIAHQTPGIACAMNASMPRV